MTHLGRIVSVILAAGLVVGAAGFLFFRSSVASEGVYKVATAVGLNTAQRERHIVPEGYTGWVVVHYSIEGAPTLQEEEGAVILEYTATGRLETSTSAPDDGGFFQRTYYRRTPHGLEPLSRAGDIWGEYSHRILRDDGNGVVERSSGFFVGTMAGFRATEWPRDHSEPKAVRK